MLINLHLFKLQFKLIVGSMTTSGSGEFYAFTHSNDVWELQKIDSEDDALSLCSFKSKIFFIKSNL